MKVEKIYLPQLNLYAISPRISKVFITSVRPCTEKKNSLIVDLEEWHLNWN